MKINTDPAFMLKPSSIWDNSHTPCGKNKIITGQDDRGTGAIYVNSPEQRPHVKVH